MSNTSNNVRNYFKLELLIARSHVILRQLFKNRYSLFNGGKVWDDSSTCGHNYSTKVIAKNKKINLTSVQKISVSNGNSDEWDLTTLTGLLLYIDRPKTLNTTQIQQLDNEDKLLTQLRDTRNKLAHHASKSITDTEFNQLWSDLTMILVAFGDIDTEIDKLKDDSVFEPCTQSINEENVKEAARLNSLGTQAHKDGRFSEAIALFTKAIVLPGILDHDRAVFYSNLSSSRLALYEKQPSPSYNFEINDSTDQRYRALQDAKKARNLWSTWCKGHFRVGKAYVALNEHEKAIDSLERALALAPTNNEIQKALDESRVIHGRQSRQEHLDPRQLPRTLPEYFNELEQNFGTDPEQIRMGHSAFEKAYPSGADVIKGHKYEHGDVDVKQDYEQAAKYFAKAASQGNAEGMYNLARLYDLGLGVKKDHKMALKLLEQAAAQSPSLIIFKDLSNIGASNVGVAEAEHSLGLRYAQGIVVHKNLAIAASWYQRAVDHGSAESANNLAAMYHDGTGVDKNLDKAQQLFEIAAKRGDPNAMKNLAHLLMDKNDFEMAKTWYDRACEAGNIVAQMEREEFHSHLQQKQYFPNLFPFDLLHNTNEVSKVPDSDNSINISNETDEDAQMSDSDVLHEYAERGSITAQNLCVSEMHLDQALDILMQSESLTEAQENEIIYELAQCYRIAIAVAKVSSIEVHQKLEKIIDRVLQRCNSGSDPLISQLDEDVRTCYATLHKDSQKLIVQFLQLCKQKYPKSIFFFNLSAHLNRSLNNYEDSLYDINTGLELDPDYCELLYQKAMLLTLLNEDIDKIIEAYQAFLAVAPKDHPEVPESYYAMAMCYLISNKGAASIDIAKKTFEEGEKAEKIQLPYFQPNPSNSKLLVESILNKESSSTTETNPSNNRKVRLTHPHRIETIKRHRQWAVSTAQTKDNFSNIKMNPTMKPRLKQQASKSLVGLKSISLKEMNPRKDHIYNGYVISLTIIEEISSWTPSIHLVVEDENLDCEQMCVYGFPPANGKYLVKEIFKIGNKMFVTNPYLRIGAYDMKPMIRVDDFSSIVMQNESENVVNMCRCCGQANALHVCAKCKKARYCSKECQTMDWKLYEHKLICKQK